MLPATQQPDHPPLSGPAPRDMMVRSHQKASGIADFARPRPIAGVIDKALTRADDMGSDRRCQVAEPTVSAAAGPCLATDPGQQA